MITKCGQCGKSFDVLYPDLWRYVRGKTYLCSWSCLRKYDGEEFDDMTRTKKDGTPAKKPGPKPKKPEAEEKIPEPAGGGEWEKMEEPELPEVLLPATCDGMVIREVEGLFGRYRYTDIGSAQYIDYENPEGLDTLSMTVDQWKKFREEQEKAARVLGVKL